MKKHIIISLVCLLGLILIVNSFTGRCVTRENIFGGGSSTGRETFIGKKIRNIQSNFVFFRQMGVGNFQGEHLRYEKCQTSVYKKLFKSLKD